MYKFLNDWPKDREMGWSEELHGVCHDEKNWYFSQNGYIWKFPLSHNLNDTCKSENKEKGILRYYLGYTLGDIDCWKEYLFVPVVGNGRPYIQVLRTSDLSPVCKQTLTRFGKYYGRINWCAIHPDRGVLYTSDDHIGAEFNENCSPVMGYEIDLAVIKKGGTDFLKHSRFLNIYDENNKPMTRKHTQGGCFDTSGRLYISNGTYTLKGTHDYANAGGGISVFIFPNRTGAKGYGTLHRIIASNQDKGFRFQFNGTGEEPRGLTYWNLDGKNAPGKLSGQLHAIMIDNLGTGSDDFYFKHYSRNYGFTYPVRQPEDRKRGLIITSCNEEVSFEDWIKQEDARRDVYREQVAELFRKRGIEYTIVVDPNLSKLKDIIQGYFSGRIDRAYTYINCHGYDGGIALGSNKDIPEADKKNRYHIPYADFGAYYGSFGCDKIFLIDSCHSGSAKTILDSAGSNAYVLCSARTEENAVGDHVYGGYATRYWCAGAGSDFVPGAADDLEADVNRDKKVTLHELLTYANKKLDFWPHMTQRCVAYPANCHKVIFD